MTHALPYILLVIFYGTLAILFQQTENVQRRTYIKTICVGVFIFFFGFRGFIFYDWASYYPLFHAFPDFSTLLTTPLSKWDTEPAFVLLGVVCKTLYPNYHFFVLICSSINLVLLWIFFKRYSDNIPLAFMLFLAFNGIMLCTDLMRNSISILLFANSVRYIEDRKPIPFFAINILGLMFHKSSLLLLPTYFFLHLRLNKWFLIVLFGIANVMFLLHIPILKTIILFLSNYVDSSITYWMTLYTKMDLDAGFGIGLGYLERLLTGTLTLCYLNRIRSLRPKSDIFINSVLLYIIIFIVFNEFRQVSMRLSNLFSFGYWILWADLIKCFTIRNNRLIFATFVGIYCILKVYGNCNYALADYENILTGARPFNERLIFFRQHFSDDRGI